MEGPEEFGAASAKGLPVLGKAGSDVHVSSTSKPPVKPVLSTVNRLTNGAKLVASVDIRIALPFRAPRLILVEQFGVRPGSGGACVLARYAAQSKSDLVNCGPSFPSLLATTSANIGMSRVSLCATSLNRSFSSARRNTCCEGAGLSSTLATIS